MEVLMSNNETKYSDLTRAKILWKSADDVRWCYGTPPVGNANYAWIQHTDHHGAGSGTSGERITRRLRVA
jgi:hypothetical protein